MHFLVIVLLMHVSAEESVEAECSNCGAEIPIDAVECPECDAVFAEDVEEVVEEIEEVGETEGKEEIEVEKKRGKSSLVSGIVLIVVGGGLALGSWLHDFWEISLGGTSYSSFGWLNILVTVTGVIIFIIGITFAALSLKKKA